MSEGGDSDVSLPSESCHRACSVTPVIRIPKTSLVQRRYGLVALDCVARLLPSQRSAAVTSDGHGFCARNDYKRYHCAGAATKKGRTLRSGLRHVVSKVRTPFLGNDLLVFTITTPHQDIDCHFHDRRFLSRYALRYRDGLEAGPGGFHHHHRSLSPIQRRAYSDRRSGRCRRYH